MNNSLDSWHARLKQQASWTKDLRKYLLDRVNLKANRKICEFGCGTGVILSEIEATPPLYKVGIDLSKPSLLMAMRNSPFDKWIIADGRLTSFQSRIFDITFCHYFLLWVKEPLQALSEMSRVTRKGGFVIAFAEPDYGGQLLFPPSLEPVKTIQQESLLAQGADPFIGRKLNSLFASANLIHIEAGVMGALWSQSIDIIDRHDEQEMIMSDLNFLKGRDVNLPGLEQYKHQIENSWNSPGQIDFVPTFYAIGQVA